MRSWNEKRERGTKKKTSSTHMLQSQEKEGTEAFINLMDRFMREVAVARVCILQFHEELSVCSVESER